MHDPVVISERNISLAWASAFLHVYHGVVSSARPVIVSVGDFEEHEPVENFEIRQAADATLAAANKLSCKINAELIFPQTLWRCSMDSGREEFYRRYREEYFPRLKARDSLRNRKGTYFLRMIDWAGPQHGPELDSTCNQLEHIIQLYGDRGQHGKRPRSSALQLACFNPMRDHTRAVRSVFPCLQQLGFIYDARGTLMLNAYYPSQFIFDRGYGNYLGLYNLGRFVATQIDATLLRLTCFIGSPKIGDVSKRLLHSLAEYLESYFPQNHLEQGSDL